MTQSEREELMALAEGFAALKPTNRKRAVVGITPTERDIIVSALRLASSTPAVEGEPAAWRFRYSDWANPDAWSLTVGHPSKFSHQENLIYEPLYLAHATPTLTADLAGEKKKGATIVRRLIDDPNSASGKRLADVEIVTGAQMDAIEAAAIAGKPLTEIPSDSSPPSPSVREALEHARNYIHNHATKHGTTRDLLNRIEAALSSPHAVAGDAALAELLREFICEFWVDKPSMKWQRTRCDDGVEMVHNAGDAIFFGDPNHQEPPDTARFDLIVRLANAVPDLLRALSVSPVTREDVARLIEHHIDINTFNKNEDGSIVIDRSGLILTISEDERILSLLNGTGSGKNVQQRACIDGSRVGESDETKSGGAV